MTITVEPKSRDDLRNLARSIRKALNLENELYFPVVELLDVLEEVLPDFSYEIIEDTELPMEKHAQTDIESGVISIKQSVYDGARKGSGRDRMTIAHELCHYIPLKLIGFKLYRSFSNKAPKVFCDPEWQAKCLAGELLIPHHLVGEMSVQDVVERCGVSELAARYQLSKW